MMVKIERWIVRRADLCLFATPSLRKAYAARYPDLADRFVTLTNGYDRNDLPAHDEPARSDTEPFRIVYAGSLYREDELDVFLEGLRRLVHRRPELRDGLRVEFVGWLSRANQEVAVRGDRADGLAGIVSYRGFRPRDEAIAAVAAADACLLIVGNDPGKEVALPGKLFEYLGLDRQVLAVVPPGDVEQTLRELDWGVVVRPEADAIAHGIEQLVSGSRRGGSADPEGRFDRVALSAQLASLLDRLAGRDGVGGPRDPDVPTDAVDA
jgi:glycosyltransferase involved in cell wall biosynthesis